LGQFQRRLVFRVFDGALHFFQCPRNDFGIFNDFLFELARLFIARQISPDLFSFVLRHFPQLASNSLLGGAKPDAASILELLVFGLLLIFAFFAT
jgi:hypothetical protein